jgi:hypothetical protein
MGHFIDEIKEEIKVFLERDSKMTSRGRKQKACLQK